MAATRKPSTVPTAAIEPELREFIDTLLVPMLVGAALRDLAEENRLALPALAVAISPRSGNE
jgi:hypothetical protein